MRIVEGRRTRDVAIDLGTGDGRFALAAAATDPRGLANALFVVAAAEALPPELDGLADLAGASAGHGLAVTGARPATPADVAASHSTWGKRLGAGRHRPAWLLEARLRARPGSAELGQAGAGLVETPGGGVHAGPGVGGGQPLGHRPQGVASGDPAVELRPAQRHRDGGAR